VDGFHVSAIVNSIARLASRKRAIVGDNFGATWGVAEIRRGFCLKKLELAMVSEGG